MPDWLQTATQANPLRHIPEILRGAFLKGKPGEEVVTHLVPLAVITLTVSAWLFRRSGA